MLFQLKKIEQYLDNRAGSLSVFDELLDDYLNGRLKSYFSELGVSKVNIFIDWQTNYKCIELQGCYKKNYVDLQIEENNFGIAVDPDEPDITNSFDLVSKEYVYLTCRNILANIL